MARGRRRAVAVLCALGVADALYMLAYHEGWIDRLVEARPQARAARRETSLAV